MRHEFKYRLGLGARIATAVVISILVAITVCTLLFVDGMYMFVCTAVISLAVIGIGVLTRPRHVIVTEDSLSIRSISYITTYRKEEILGMDRIASISLELPFPLICSCGLFGSYGIFYSLRHLQKTMIFAAHSRNPLRITLSTDDALILGLDGDDEIEKQIRLWSTSSKDF